MHHLHPRSSATSTLFTTTLAVSFLVVGLPHLLPCPVDRRQFADSIETSDGQVKKRRRRRDDAGQDETSNGSRIDKTRQRECPVPKPAGFVGQMMGFEQKEKERPVEVVVKSLREKDAERESKDGETKT